MLRMFPRFRRRRSSLAAALILLLLSPVVLEIALRVILGLGNPIREQTDPFCGKVVMPNQSVRRFFCLNETNEYSMRSPPISEHKPVGTFRVFFIGDSVTYGTTYVDQTQIFSTLVGRRLPAVVGKRVEILNSSKGAWATGNELAYLQSRGTFEADVIIFVLNTGDLIQPFNGEPTPGPPVQDYKPPTAIGELWTRYLAPKYLHQAVAVDAGSVAAPPSAQPIESLVQPVLANLAEAKSIAEKGGAKFAIVFTRARGMWETPQSRETIDLFRGWIRAQGIPLEDMSDVVARVPGDEFYFDSIHLRPKGDALVADRIIADWSRLTSTPASSQGSTTSSEH